MANKQNEMKRKGDFTSSNGENAKNQVKISTLKKDKEEREMIVIWKKPLTTLNYFFREIYLETSSFIQKMLIYRKTLIAGIITLSLILLLININGPHEVFMALVKKKIVWCSYWVFLGVLSSIGFGTGLHTFIFYLGPHIASVTRAAYNCGGLNFPEPPYPDSIVCPEVVDPSWQVSIWNIMMKVGLESIMWGAGTALGELPPYFMARAARLSGEDKEDEDEFSESEELQSQKEDAKFYIKVKLIVEDFVKRFGFWAILLCASIPNPLFDLAGITCGHFLIPFKTFFGATLIGKAVIKMMVQSMGVIMLFSDTLLDKVMLTLSNVPLIGSVLQKAVIYVLGSQKNRLLHKNEEDHFLKVIFDKLIQLMICCFIVSIVNSLAQSYHKRLCKNKNKQD